MSSPAQQAVPQSRFARVSQVLMASCLGVMAVAVFINVVLRYGFGSGVAASEELSRLLFVWMVFIGAAAAYPAGEHMAFTSLAGLLAQRPVAFGVLTAVIRLLVMAACAMSMMRRLMPPEFISSPARMKKGTASSGKLSTPATRFWASS